MPLVKGHTPHPQPLGAVARSEIIMLILAQHNLIASEELFKGAGACNGPSKAAN